MNDYHDYLIPGIHQKLSVVRTTDHGAVLASRKGEEVLLPRRYTQPWMQPGAELEVFIYHDGDGRIVATTETPSATLGEATTMRIVSTTADGAFADWGLAKDLFIPKTHQKEPLRPGDETIVVVMQDRKRRLFGSTRLGKGFDRRPQFKRNQAVSLLIFGKTELGYKAIVEKRYEGLIFHSEIFAPIQIGQQMTGYVKQIRQDGKIDLLTRPIGKKSDTLAMDGIMAYLRSHGGIMPLTYKSQPEAIRTILGLSRKNFKRALTALIDKGVVEVDKSETRIKRRQP